MSDHYKAPAQPRARGHCLSCDLLDVINTWIVAGAPPQALIEAFTKVMAQGICACSAPGYEVRMAELAAHNFLDDVKIRAAAAAMSALSPHDAGRA